MKNWHPASWSKQARQFSDKIYDRVVNAYEENRKMEFYDSDWEYHQVDDPELWGVHVFNFSYRHPRIVNRAAKRFGKKIRKYKKTK